MAFLLARHHFRCRRFKRGCATLLIFKILFPTKSIYFDQNYIRRESITAHDHIVCSPHFETQFSLFNAFSYRLLFFPSSRVVSLRKQSLPPIFFRPTDPCQNKTNTMDAFSKHRKNTIVKFRKKWNSEVIRAPHEHPYKIKNTHAQNGASYLSIWFSARRLIIFPTCDMWKQQSSPVAKK